MKLLAYFLAAAALAAVLSGCSSSLPPVVKAPPPPIASVPPAPPVVKPPKPNLMTAKIGIANPGQGAVGTLNDFGDWLGRPMQWNVTWTDNFHFTWAQTVGEFNSYLNTDHLDMWKAAGRGITISIPLVMYNETLATAATDADAASWIAIGADLVAHGHDGQGGSPVVLSLGWEGNGSWYAWHATGGKAADYVAAFRLAAAHLKATPGSNFLIEWRMSLTGNGVHPIDTMYPGDDVVDVIGLDVYNKPQFMPAQYQATPALSWQYNKSVSNGGLSLDWFAAFAASHGKPMSMAEWGQNVDDPYFIQQMAEWIPTQNMLYWVYFSTALGTYSLDLNPLSKAAFLENFATVTPPTPLPPLPVASSVESTGGDDDSSGWWGPQDPLEPIFPLNPTLGYVPGPPNPAPSNPLPLYALWAYDNGFVGYIRNS